MQSRLSKRKNSESGFTLLEVIITIGILMTMAVAVTELLSNNLEIRQKTSQAGKVTHRLSMAMDRLAGDITHAFIVRSNDLIRNAKRNRKTIFKFNQSGNSTELRFTGMNNNPMRTNAKESDSYYVVYKVQEDREISGVTHLFRGSMPFLPEDLSQDPTMKVVTRYIKAFRVEAWRGDRWVKDRWDTTKSDYRDTLPYLIKIEIEAYLYEPDGPDDTEWDKDKVPVEVFSTVINLPYAINASEKKEKSKTIRWDRM